VEHQYSPSRHALRPLDEYFVQYRERSARWVGVDTVVPGRPLLVYIHGGYWQRLSAADSLFNGDDADAHGISLHAVEYTLAPSATVEQIVEECIDDVERVIAGAAAPRVAVAVNLVVPERDHFDLPYDILREGTALGDHVLKRLLG